MSRVAIEKFSFHLIHGFNESNVEALNVECDGSPKQLGDAVKMLLKGKLHGVLEQEDEELVEFFQEIATAFMEALVDFPSEDFHSKLDKDFLALQRQFKNIYKPNQR
jgi:hypothetical protein